MRNQPQLIAYVDRLSGGTLENLGQLLAGPLAGAFGGVHLLPFFHPIDGADAGFDPIDHTEVDPRLGTWADVRALASQTDVMADVIVNHISSRSPQFRDYDARGDNSPYAGMFLTYARVFPQGARASESARPTLPASRSAIHATPDRAWPAGAPVDHLHTGANRHRRLSPRGPALSRRRPILSRFCAAGIRAIRVDAAGFAVKKAGTSCFMIPETFAFLEDFTARAHALGIEVLVEVHGHYLDQVHVARQVDWVYDFALPPLVLHTLYTRDATALTRWIGTRASNAVTVLDTHDGIGVLDAASDREGRAGLLLPPEIDALVNAIHERSGGSSRAATGSAASNLDAYQINCTFYDALGGRDDELLIPRAHCSVSCLEFRRCTTFGMLAGSNDMTLLSRTGVGRDINRHYYTPDEVQQQLKRPVVQKLLALLKFRHAPPGICRRLRDECFSAVDRDAVEARRRMGEARCESDKHDSIRDRLPGERGQ